MTLETPDSAETTLAEAEQALNDGHIDRAMAAYRPLIANGGEDELSAMVGLAVAHARRKQWDEAEKLLKDVLERAPDSGPTRAYLASVELELGKVQEAMDDMDRALKDAPGNAIVRLKNAELLLRLGRLPDGYAELQRAAKLPPPDDATRDYIRQLAMSVKKQLAHSIDKRGASPAEFWRALVARVQGKPLPGIDAQ